MIKKTIFFAFLAASMQLAHAQTDVTSKYIDNPSFEARFAGWHNDGFYFVTNSSFGEKKGNIYMERWVSAGNKINDVSLSQEIKNLPSGTYTLVAGCQNVQQADGSLVCSGATLYANDYTLAVNASKEYRLTFNVVTGKTLIGFKTESSNGNWASIDNVRLLKEDDDVAGLHAELQKLIDAAESAIGSKEATAELTTAIDAAKTLVASDGVDNIAEVGKTLAKETLRFRVETATGTMPTVTGDPYIAAGSTILLGRFTYSARSGILEKGYCYSTTNKEPTILDDRSTDCFDYNGYIYRMEKMEPGTIYYVRPYVLTKKYQLGYGDVVKVATLPKGNVTSDYDNGAGGEANYRIASAIEEIKWLYNNLSSVTNFNISVHYGSQTPTADCSYGGYMRIGPNDAYQQTGTVLHETNHGVGVGTSSPWWSGTYREGGDNGRWLGPRATKMIQFLNNDAGAYMTGDNTHMWPISSYDGKHFGINGSFEDTYNPEDPLLYYGNVLITHALHQDGLISTESLGFAAPAYTFTQDDDAKYYIKNSDDACGNNSTYLTVDDEGNLVMKAASAKKAKSDDNFAWAITYNAKTAMYVFRNIGTGRLITYDNGFTTVERSGNGTSFDRVQLLPSRENYTKGDLTTTSYWMTNSKKALKGTTSTTTCTASFNDVNSATAQRWLFLTEEQMEVLDKYYVGQEIVGLDELIKEMRQTLATPYKSANEDMTKEEVAKPVTDLLATVEAEKADYGVDEIQTAESNLRATFVEALANMTPESAEHPLNIRWIIDNPDFTENGDGWSEDIQNVNCQCGEFFEKTFNIYQTLPEMPAGTYALTMQGFQRTGGYSTVYDDYVAGTDNVKATLYLNHGDKTDTQIIKNLWAESLTHKLAGTCANMNGNYAPDTMESAQSWFKAGYYQNAVYSTVDEPTSLKIGLRSRKSDSLWWTCFDNFNLLYFGSFTAEEAETGVQAIRDYKQSDGAIYNINGTRVSGTNLPKGVYIINGKKVVIK